MMMFEKVEKLRERRNIKYFNGKNLYLAFELIIKQSIIYACCKSKVECL